MSDLHYRRCVEGESRYMRMVAQMRNPLDRFTRLVRQARQTYGPFDLLAVTGDLCEGGEEADYRRVKAALEAAGVPYVVCLGNHDRKESFYMGWGMKRSSAPYMEVRHFAKADVLIFDNSAYRQPDGVLDAERLLWLENALRRAHDPIVCMHHPLSPRPGIPALAGGEALEKLFRKFPPKLVLMGHTHWFDAFEADGYACRVAPSVSFRGESDAQGNVSFYESQGYCIYDIDHSAVKDVACFVTAEKKALLTLKKGERL